MPASRPSSVAVGAAVLWTTACSLGLPDSADAPAASTDGGGAASHKTQAAADAGAAAPSSSCKPESSTDSRTVMWKPPATRRKECGVTEMEEIGRCTANAYDLHGCDHMKAKYARCWACAVSQLDDAVHGAIIADSQLDGFWPNHAGCVATETKDEACGKAVYMNDVCSLRICDHCNSDAWDSCIEQGSGQCEAKYRTTCAGNALARCFYRAPNEDHYIGLIEYFCGG